MMAIKRCLTYLENRNIGTTNQNLHSEAKMIPIEYASIIFKYSKIKINGLNTPLKKPERVAR